MRLNVFPDTHTRTPHFVIFRFSAWGGPRFRNCYARKPRSYSLFFGCFSRRFSVFCWVFVFGPLSFVTFCQPILTNTHHNPGSVGRPQASTANAMSILCRSGYSFAGRDLSGIRVSFRFLTQSTMCLYPEVSGSDRGADLKREGRIQTYALHDFTTGRSEIYILVVTRSGC